MLQLRIEWETMAYSSPSKLKSLVCCFEQRFSHGMFYNVRQSLSRSPTLCCIRYIPWTLGYSHVRCSRDTVVIELMWAEGMYPRTWSGSLTTSPIAHGCMVIAFCSFYQKVHDTPGGVRASPSNCGNRKSRTGQDKPYQGNKRWGLCAAQSGPRP